MLANGHILRFCVQLELFHLQRFLAMIVPGSHYTNRKVMFFVLEILLDLKLEIEGSRGVETHVEKNNRLLLQIVLRG